MGFRQPGRSPEHETLRHNRPDLPDHPMSTAKLLGILFLVCALFIVTRGIGWHAGYIALGSAVGFVGLLLLTGRRTRPIRKRQVYVTSRPIRALRTRA